MNTNNIWNSIKDVRLNLLKRTGDRLDVWKEKCASGLIVDTNSNLVDLAKILQINLGICRL